MEENNEQNQNVGDPNAGDPGAADPGIPGADPAVDPGTPGASGGEQTDERDATIETQKAEIKRLNRAIVDTRRKGRANEGGSQNNYDAETLQTPEGQYAVSLEVADGRLRGGLEGRLNLYPEIPDEEKSRIRTNPWAFASRKAYMTGDHELALDEIELKLADRIDELAEAKKTTPDPQDNPTSDPANVTGNPAPESEGGEDAPAGSEGDTNPWTMPIDKLEKLKNKQVRELAQKK